MPLPVWINLQQTMLRNASNAPCDFYNFKSFEAIDIGVEIVLE